MLPITDVVQCFSNQGGRPGADWGMSVRPGGASVNQPACLPSSKASLLRTGPFQVFPPLLSKALDPLSFGGSMVAPQPDSPLSPTVLCLVASSGQQSCRAHRKCQGMTMPSPLPSRQDRYINAPAPLLPPCPGVAPWLSEGLRGLEPPSPTLAPCLLLCPVLAALPVQAHFSPPLPVFAGAPPRLTTCVQILVPAGVCFWGPSLMRLPSWPAC